MRNKGEFLKNIDRKIFQFVDTLKVNPIYIHLTDAINNLDDTPKNIINYFITFFIILSPLLIALIFALNNMSLKNQIKVQEDIINTANHILERKNQIKQTQSQLFGPASISSQSDLMSQLSSIAGQYGLNSKKIHVDQFEIHGPTNGMVRISSKIGFTDLSLKELNDLSIGLNNSKMFFKHVEITKNRESALLSGQFEITYISTTQEEKGRD